MKRLIKIKGFSPMSKHRKSDTLNSRLVLTATLAALLIAGFSSKTTDNNRTIRDAIPSATTQATGKNIATLSLTSHRQ